jgi:hypothetical protein
VPLSEHEQRQLEQIEQGLRADDPRFADIVHGADPRVHYKRRVIAAALGFLRVPAKDRQAGKQAGTGLMARLEERWRRRQGGDR